MPTYSYHCESCNMDFDAFQKITEEALKNCPHCGKDALRRGIGGGSASFQFKGDGYYLTDYKKSSSTMDKQPPCCPCGKNKNNCSS